jgi:hypothetical protein
MMFLALALALALARRERSAEAEETRCSRGQNDMARRRTGGAPARQPGW